MTIDHVIPYVVGGETSSQNLLTLCHECNGKKGCTGGGLLSPDVATSNGIDLSLIRGRLSKAKLLLAKIFSLNLMHTRCELD